MNTQTTGIVGESVCARFLQRQGFVIVARNYRKKWGELDIVALKDGVLHVFEVKSTKVSRFTEFRDSRDEKNVHRPEEHVHQAKLARLRRTTQTFLAERGKGPDTAFIFHILVVYIDVKRHTSRIFWIKNVVL